MADGLLRNITDEGAIQYNLLLGARLIVSIHRGHHLFSTLLRTYNKQTHSLEYFTRLRIFTVHVMAFELIKCRI